jgi:hypothetical protein
MVKESGPEGNARNEAVDKLSVANAIKNHSQQCGRPLPGGCAPRQNE